jgi:hypothetical protein
VKTTKYKSNLEAKFNESFNLPYETATMSYWQAHTYTPDWTLGSNHYIETKGRWIPSDRAKLKRVMQQHSLVKIVMVFQNPDTPLNKGSKRTYGSWCEKNGITFFKAGSEPLAAYIADNALHTSAALQ